MKDARDSMTKSHTPCLDLKFKVKIKGIDPGQSTCRFGNKIFLNKRLFRDNFSPSPAKFSHVKDRPRIQDRCNESSEGVRILAELSYGYVTRTHSKGK
jgi:hypothetical protein